MSHEGPAAPETVADVHQESVEVGYVRLGVATGFDDVDVVGFALDRDIETGFVAIVI